MSTSQRAVIGAWLLATTLVACGGDARDGAENLAESLQAARTLPERGGSNYVMIGIGDYLNNPTNEIWYTPGALKPVVGTYHQHVSRVRRQLRTMYANGQRRLALMIWIEDLHRAGHGLVHGHLIDASGGRIAPQHQKNLEALIADVARARFSGLTIRFATQGSLSPSHWSSWNESAYQTSWNFIVNTKRAADAAAKRSSIQLHYDLGVELGGLEAGQARAYTRRLFRDYRHVFGAHANGFSLAFNRARLERYIDDMRNVGATVPALYLDMYGDVFAALQSTAKALQAKGMKRKPIVIQETHYNDARTNQQIWRARSELGLNIRAVYQWPLHRGARAKHFSMHYPADYRAYLQSPSGPTPQPDPRTRSPRPQIVRAGTGCSDHYCLWIQVRNPGNAPCVDVRPAGSSTIIDTYCGKDLAFYPRKNPPLITLRLRTRNDQRGRLDRAGLKVWVVNRQARNWSSGYFVQR
jgi:hypothetical protein